ncbi:C40 family peptidase [Streptomyces longwoodensis]|uniref:C40 family peptidase n=1 Tax=Streptomyces longwoodensis TaxID=68231 RepID=UPI002ED13F8B|nr:C40 family peptidase [Streptomyces longwoodensis]
MPTDRSQDLMGTDLVGLSGSAPAVTTLPSVPAQPTGSALLEELVPPSRAEVQQRVNALYDRAESDTGTFNATRAMASGARRGSPAGRTSDADVSAVARQWFDSARSAFGPIVPAVLPRDRTPERPAVAPRPPRAVEPAGTRELESAERHVPELTARTLPALPPAPSADGLRASHDDGIELQGARALSPAPAAASAQAVFPRPTAPAPEPLPAEPAWYTGQLPTYGTGAVTWGTQDTGMMAWGAQDAGATAWAAQDAGTTAWGGQDAGAATGQTGGMQDSGSMQWAAQDTSATTWGAQDTGATAWATQATQDTGAMTWGMQETGAHNWDALRMGTTPWAAQDTGGFSAPSALTDTGVYASPSALTDTGAYAVPSPLTDTGGFATPLPLTDTGSFAAPFALTDTGGFAIPSALTNTGAFAAPSALTDTSGYAVPSAAPDAVGFATAPVTADPVPAAPVAPATVGSSPAAPVHTAKADKAVAFARAQLGKPCVWGAKGPGSYDCSGLTQAAWTAAGLPLPRATADQAGAGTPVELADLRPGDLIFFFDGLRHTGLYTGDGLMIHAPGPGAFVSEESIFHAGEDAIRCAVRPA